jgi:hypothetical protein
MIACENPRFHALDRDALHSTIPVFDHLGWEMAHTPDGNHSPMAEA